MVTGVATAAVRAGGILPLAMKTSPFPGMDPYLERRWGDVHVRLIGGISAALQPNLPLGLQALGQEEIRLESGIDDEPDDGGDDVATGEGPAGSGRRLQSYDPDVAIIEEVGAAGTATAELGQGVATIAPIVVRFILE